MNSNLPLVIPVHNNLNYLKPFLEASLKNGFEQIFILDNKSTDQDLLQYFKTLSDSIKVLHLKENFGPRYPLHSLTMQEKLPKKFFLSDPDLEYNSNLPKYFKQELIDISEKYKVGKVGFALDIFSEQIDNSIELKTESKIVNLIEYERKHWSREVGKTSDGAPLFLAYIDTTFCLVNLEYFDAKNELAGIRMGGDYTATHLPWLKSNKKLPQKTSLFSSLVIEKIDPGHLSTKIVEQNLYIAFLKVQIENLNLTTSHQNYEIQSFYSSTSWKLTKPFRALFKFLKINK